MANGFSTSGWGAGYSSGHGMGPTAGAGGLGAPWGGGGVRIPLGPEGALACARGSGYTLRHPRTLEIIRENVPLANAQQQDVTIIHDQDPRCEGRGVWEQHGPGAVYENLALFQRQSGAAEAVTYPRRTVIRSYPVISSPVDDFIQQEAPAPPPVSMRHLVDTSFTPAPPAMPRVVPVPEPPRQPVHAEPGGMFTFLGAEVDATRSRFASEAVSRNDIRGETIVRGVFNGRYRPI